MTIRPAGLVYPQKSHVPIYRPYKQTDIQPITSKLIQYAK